MNIIFNILNDTHDCIRSTVRITKTFLITTLFIIKKRIRVNSDCVGLLFCTFLKFTSCSFIRRLNVLLILKVFYYWFKHSCIYNFVLIFIIVNKFKVYVMTSISFRICIHIYLAICLSSSSQKQDSTLCHLTYSDNFSASKIANYTLKHVTCSNTYVNRSF